MNTSESVIGDGATIEEGRRARKARATRRALLEAGLEAFERQPISLVSVLDITEAADVAKGVFYLHFASKDAFLIDLWLDVQECFLAGVRSAVSTAVHSRSRIAAAIGQYARAAAEQPCQVCFLLRMSSFVGEELGLPGQLAQRRVAYLHALARAVADVGGQARLRKTDIAAASAMDACCWGVIWQTRQLGLRPPSAKELVKIVLPAVAPRVEGLASR